MSLGSDVSMLERLARSLALRPGMNKHDLMQHLRSEGLEVTSKSLNQILYGNSDRFRWETGEGSERRWFLVSTLAEAVSDGKVLKLRRSDRWS